MYEKLFRKCIPIADNADNEVYEESFLKFKDDYDRANPHTFKHGKFRMINMQIEKAKANPDEFDAMKLKGFEDQRFKIEKANILSKSRQRILNLEDAKVLVKNAGMNESESLLKKDKKPDNKQKVAPK
jgi:hypothetical protein